MFLLNVYVPVFADPKGNPLAEHLEYVGKVRKKFETTENEFGDPTTPCKWEHEPSFLFFSDDYRTVKVYNIPHIIVEREKDNGFLRHYAQALLEARRIKNSTKAVAECFVQQLNNVFRTSGCTARIAHFLGTDEETAIESFITSLFLSSNSRLLGGLTAASCVALNAFNFLQPILLPSLVVAPPVAIAITVAHNLLNVARVFTTKGAFQEEKVANYALVLSIINQMFLTDPESILSSNVLVTATDERSFNSLLLWNSFPGRRNDGAWAGFVHIGNLRCAPMARNYRNGNVVPRYIEIFNEIMRNGELDLVRLDGYINGRPSPLRPLQEARAEETHG
jgi:hypothetical protein